MKAAAAAATAAGISRQRKRAKRASPSSYNNFQARYAIRHWWTGKISCKAPVRGRWGGPPGGGGIARSTPALNLAFAPRNASLPRLLVSNVPEIGVRAYRKRKPAPRPPTGGAR